MLIAVSEIKVNPGRREVEMKNVRKLAESISKVGLLSAITVSKENILIAGLHRLEAIRFLGWTMIECTVTSLEGLEAELAQIDENFVRCDLSDMEYNDLLLRRKEIYESLHPETRRGMRNGQTSKTDTGSVLETKSFSQDSSEKLGVTPRTIERKIQIAKNLTPEVKKIVDDNDIGFRNALKLSRLEPEQQKEAVSQLVSGEIKSISDYHNGKAATQAYDDTDTYSGDVEERGRTFEEDVAYMKSNDKDPSCTTGAFLADVGALVNSVQQHIAWYSVPYYEEIFPLLTDGELRDLRDKLDSIHREVDELYKMIERKSKK